MADPIVPHSIDALASAAFIAEQLDHAAMAGSDSSGWFTVQRMHNGEWQIQPAGPDLYSGLPGIILFLAYLDYAEGDDRYLPLARRAFANLRRMLSRLQDESPGGLGAFNGLSGIVYLCSHLAVLWDDERILDLGGELAAKVQQRVPADRAFDWIGGAAGCIAALLSLHSVDGSQKTLSSAVACGEWLFACATRTESGVGWVGEHERYALAGIAHGSAGIALSLFRLADATGESRFRRLAESALAHERSLFNESCGAWADLRRSRIGDGPAGGEGFAFSPGWCNGSAGIAMSRMSMGAFTGATDETLEAEIHAGIHSCLTSPIPQDFSLCHGIAGNSELVTIAGDRYDDAGAFRPVLTSEMVRVAREPEWKPPGLMDGLAGLGYALLRAAHPEEVPSVPLLCPPPNRP